MLNLKQECNAMGLSIPEYFAIRRLLEIANGRQIDEETKNRVVATIERRFPEVPVWRIPQQFEIDWDNPLTVGMSG